MRVLFITHHYLDDNSGGSFASRAYINAFTEIADSCMLMYPDKGTSVTEFIHKKCVLKGVKHKRSNVGKVIDYYLGRLHRYYKVMIPQIKDFQPDIVVFDNSRTTAGMLKKVKKLGVKTITIHHNYEMEYYKGTKPSILWRIPFLYFMEKTERNAVLQSDLSLTLTDEDKILLQKHYDSQKSKKIAKLGSFESVKDSISMNNESKTIQNQLTFAITGSLGTYQTEVSVIPFLENEYPELLKVLPASKLIIAGRNPTAKMISACSVYPSVELIANPVNMQEIISRADVYICPTCVGGGLKLRVMDGLKVGLPVLTHAVSARGYEEFIKAKCMFVYDDNESFKLSLQNLLIELRQGNLDSNTIKTIYKSVFSFEAGVLRLKEILVQNMII